MKELEKQIEYWIKSAKNDLETAESLFKSKHYDWCLFLSHLVIEKILNLTFTSSALKNLQKNISLK